MDTTPLLERKMKNDGSTQTRVPRVFVYDVWALRRGPCLPSSSLPLVTQLDSFGPTSLSLETRS